MRQTAVKTGNVLWKIGILRLQNVVSLLQAQPGKVSGGICHLRLLLPYGASQT
jgi:hypothetical protein